MAKLSIVAGATSQSVNVFIQDSSSTVGVGLANVAPAGGSLLSGTKCYYSFTGTNAASVAVSLTVLATVGAAYSSTGMVEIDATNMKGWYRLDLPNAVLAGSKGRVVSVLIFGGTNMAPCPLEIELTGFDNQSTTDGGLSKLTSLTFTVAGKIDADVYAWNGTAVASPATAGIPDINVKNIVNVAAVLDANNLLKVDVEDVNGTAGGTAIDGQSLIHTWQIIAAAVAGKCSGGPGNPVFLGLDGSTTRITGVADVNGNRTTATYS